MQQKNKQLPEDWKEVEIGDILNYEQPGKYIVNDEDYNEKYKTPVLTAGKSFILGYTNEKEGIYDTLPVIIFDDFTMDNKFVTFPFKVKSSAMKLLTPKNKDIDLKFIFLLMQTIKLSSATHKRYYLSTYQNIKILLPPLPIQKQIVSILEKAEELKQKRGEADKLTKEYLQSVFYEMFLKKENKFNNVKLGSVAKFINGRAFKPSEWKTQGKIIIRIQDLTGNIENPNFTTQIFDSKYLVKKGDLLISWSATLDVFIWNKEEGWLNQHIFKVVEDNKIINKEFLFYLVKDKIEEMKRNTHGSTMKHITKGNFDSIEIPLPPLPLQQKFASIVEHIEKLKEKQQKSKEEINNLFNSLMQKAFKGELVR